MVGGGRGAFIGAVHRIAAVMDGRAELVAGRVLERPVRSRPPGRTSSSIPRASTDPTPRWRRPRRDAPDRRLDFVVIVTPNHQHFEPARLFLEAGFNVVCDKPVTFDLAQARKLRRSRGRGRSLS
jgi:predicted dehydrogenase